MPVSCWDLHQSRRTWDLRQAVVEAEVAVAAVAAAAAVDQKPLLPGRTLSESGWK